MTVKGNIRIKNIYNMLAYAFKDVLKEKKSSSMDYEEFEHQSDLMAAILVAGVDLQIKRGMYKSYVPVKDACNCPVGKIDISSSIKGHTMTRSMVVCEYDDYTANIECNRILKTTMNILIRDASMSPKYRKELRRTLLFFDDIDPLDPSHIKWSKIHYHKNNVTYRMLLFICKLVIIKSLMHENSGKKNLSNYFDDQLLHNLFENFVRAYFKAKHGSYVNGIRQVKWNLDYVDSDIHYLPKMETDLMLMSENITLIIDTKFYQRITQGRHESMEKIRSNHLYQMYAYVKNKAGERIREGSCSGNVCGLILYAKTEADEIPYDLKYSIDGNDIHIKTLNLNDDWKEIEARLDSLKAIILN